MRTSYVFGGGTDYISKAAQRLAAAEPAGAIIDCTGSPTYVRHLAARLVPLLVTERFGTYHLGGPEATSRHDLLTRIRSMGGLPGEVQVQRVDALSLPAPRPRNSSLVSLFLHEAGISPMPALDVAVKEFLDERGL